MALRISKKFAASLQRKHHNFHWSFPFPVKKTRLLKSKPHNSASKALVKGIPGLYLFPNVISPELESYLLSVLDEDNEQVPWVDRKSRLTKNYGPHYRYIEWETCQGRMRQCDGNIYQNGLPDWLESDIMPLLRKLGFNEGRSGRYLLSRFRPNQIHVAKYDGDVGHRIGMHNDNRMGVLGDFIVGVCLGAKCEMIFESPDGRKRKTVKLNRRCVYVMSGDSHRRWKHGIAKGVTDGVRVSLTLRELYSIKAEEGTQLMRKTQRKLNSGSA